jgi:hypothetical protein
VTRPHANAWPVRAAAAGCLWLGLAAPAGAEEKYFLVVFGSQRKVFQPDYTHSSAAFVKAVGTGPDLGTYRFETQMISWLPATLNVQVLSALPEPGVNLDLHGTLRLALARQEVLARWGPYRVEKELYDKALAQLVRLREGRVRYKALDSGFPCETASNCIHAVADVTGRGWLRIATPGWGHFASYVLTQRFRPWVLDDGKVYPEVAEKLKLGKYPMIEQDLNVNRRDWLSLASGSGVRQPPKAPPQMTPPEGPEPPLAPTRLIPNLLRRVPQPAQSPGRK